MKNITQIPTGKHYFKCPTCLSEFVTRYSHQIYCLNPCEAKAKKLPKQEAKKKTRAENVEYNREAKRKEKEFRALSQKWLRTKL